MKQNIPDNTKAIQKIPIIIYKKKNTNIIITMEHFVSCTHHANLIEILYPSTSFKQIKTE